MNWYILRYSVFLLFIFSCNTNHQEQEATLAAEPIKNNTAINDTCSALLIIAKQTDNVLMRATNFNIKQAEQGIVDFINYTTNCKNDTLTPVFLIKAAQLAQSINNFQKAEMLLNQCIDEHVRYPNKGAAMFLLAQLYDDEKKLNNETQAKAIYQSIIKEYPTSSWANDAKAAISNLGKSDEQLVKEFLKKNS